MTAFVPIYRYGLAPDSNRVPSYDAPTGSKPTAKHNILRFGFGVNTKSVISIFFWILCSVAHERQADKLTLRL